MTPILSFTTIIPLSMENLKKSVTSSVNLDIPLEMTSPPQHISYSAFIISLAKKLHTVGLI